METANVRFSGNLAGQPGEATPEPVQKAAPAAASGQTSPAPEKNAPQMITMDEAKKMAREAASEVFRDEQSRRDKAETRVMKFAQDQLAAAKNAGTQMNAEQEQAFLQATANRFRSEFTETSPEPAQGAGGKQPEKPEEPLSEIEQAALDMVTEAGFDIMANDPEIKLIDTSNLRKYLSSYEQALDAKRKRLTGQGIDPANPRINLPGLGGRGSSAPSHQGLSGSQTLNQYFSGFRTKHQG